MNTPIISQKTVGGAGGHEFTACAEGPVKGFNIRSGAWIDAVQVIYNSPAGHDDSTERFGGQGGGLGSFMLEPGEQITMVRFTYGQHVNSITIGTSHERSATFGEPNGPSETFEITGDYEFAGFYGRCGAYVDAIGILLYDRRALSRGGNIFGSSL